MLQDQLFISQFICRNLRWCIILDYPTNNVNKLWICSGTLTTHSSTHHRKRFRVDGPSLKDRGSRNRQFPFPARLLRDYWIGINAIILTGMWRSCWSPLFVVGDLAPPFQNICSSRTPSANFLHDLHPRVTGKLDSIYISHSCIYIYMFSSKVLTDIHIYSSSEHLMLTFWVLVSCVVCAMGDIQVTSPDLPVMLQLLNQLGSNAPPTWNNFTDPCALAPKVSVFVCLQSVLAQLYTTLFVGELGGYILWS